jgi:hypothetical protein
MALFRFITSLLHYVPVGTVISKLFVGVSPASCNHFILNQLLLVGLQGGYVHLSYFPPLAIGISNGQNHLIVGLRKEKPQVISTFHP